MYLYISNQKKGKIIFKMTKEQIIDNNFTNIVINKKSLIACIRVGQDKIKNITKGTLYNLKELWAQDIDSLKNIAYSLSNCTFF